MNEVSDFNILIVDDEKSNLDILNYILKLEHTVYVAKSGNSAIKRANADKPDLILLDLILPDMTGFEVLSELKQSSITCNIPVIIISGLDSVKDEEKGFLLGAVDYIKKPFQASIVKARVETHLKIIKQMRIIERLGFIDVLTDIQNRRSFDHQINSEWGKAVREKTPISMLMIDIDKFKVYNDKYGHQQGDVLLKIIAKIFVSTVNRITDLVFRWGGEEFVILIPNTNMEDALSIAEKIRSNVESACVPCINGEYLTNVTISIGAVSSIPSYDYQISDFISKADNALYDAKRSGRNRVCFR